MTHYSFRIGRPHFARLMAHLFPGDGEHHGAIVVAGVARSSRGVRLLARDVFLARDGMDYVPSQRGHRALTGEFVARVSDHCCRQGLAYFAVHCHRGTNTVSFSSTDLQSHKRGYPALLDITKGGPVGALVFTENAVAGQVWTPEGVEELHDLTVVGLDHRRLFPSPRRRWSHVDPRYDRQALLFGVAGQELLHKAKVGIIGLGGAGSLISEWLARLGVGELVAVDFDKVEPSNLSRVVGATRWDAQEFLSTRRRPWLRALGRRLAAYKVHVARRVARQAQPRVRYVPLVSNITSMDAALALKDADYLFFCADRAQSRLVFNALVHQYLIPGMQVGSKVPIEARNGQVGDVFAVSRPVMPITGGGCLDCNELISAAKLQDEALSPEERRRKGYVDDPDVHAPSVITLNALACGRAANDFLMSYLGLFYDSCDDRYLLDFCRERRPNPVGLKALDTCLHCGLAEHSAYARGDGARLPCKAGR